MDGDRVRLFDVYMARDIGTEMPLMIGATTIDYDCTINIDVCYMVMDSQSAYMANDFDKIRRAVINSDTSALTGYNFSAFAGYEVVPSDKDDSKFRFMRIPVRVRVSVTA